MSVKSIQFKHKDYVDCHNDQIEDILKCVLHAAIYIHEESRARKQQQSSNRVLETVRSNVDRPEGFPGVPEKKTRHQNAGHHGRIEKRKVTRFPASRRKAQYHAT
jgi:hypothetical protein